MKKFFIALALILSVNSFANTVIVSADEFEPKSNGSSKTSEQNRIDKKFDFTYGFFSGTLIGISASGAYHLDRNSLITLEGRGGTNIDLANIVVGAIVGYSDQLSVQMLSLGYKKFLGNSFYIHTGLSHYVMSFSRTYGGDAFKTPITSQGSFQVNNLDAYFGLGNQWQWDSFTLGCDWLRIDRAISSNISNESYTSTTIQNEINNKKNYYSDLPSVTASFYLGWSF